MFVERDQNFNSFTARSHLWTNSSNYLENLQRGAKIEFAFRLQSRFTTSKKIKNNNLCLRSETKILIVSAREATYGRTRQII